MSVGHAARAFEAAGMPTVIIAVKAFETKLRQMRLPRVLLTPQLMGRPLGVPKDADGQIRVMEKALDLLETAARGSTYLEIKG